jgi:ribonuclease HII
MTAPSLAPPDESRLLARPRVRESGMWAYENALRRLGFDRIAGVDEAGRGACAGPLVAGAVVLPEGRRGRVPGLADSKLLNAVVREEVYAEVVARALCWSAVVVPAAEVDRVGLHRANVAALRRALWLLDDCPSYVLSDGFPAACIAAASVVAKVTRDRLMVEMDARFPAYGFAQHKGYITPEHQASLSANGPCPEHRRSFVNVRMRDNGRYADPDDIEDVPAVCDAAGQGDLL